MDEFIRKKILYFLKYMYDRDPHHPVDLLEHFENEVSEIERNTLYLSNKYLVEQTPTRGHNHVLAKITAEGIDFVERDTKSNYEINIFEFMRENLKKRTLKLKFNDFPEYLFPDRERLNAKLLKYEPSDVVGIHPTGTPKRVDLVFLKDTLINRLEDLRRERELYMSSLEQQPPIFNIANIGHMEGSQIQQGTIDSIQEGTFKITNQENLSEFIELLKSRLPELKISEEDHPEIKSDIKTIEVQMESNRPKAIILEQCLSSIKRILKRALETSVANQLLTYIPALIEMVKTSFK